MRRGRWLRAAGCVVLLILTLALTVYGASEGSSVTAVKLVRDTEGYHLDITAALSSQDADVLRGETVYLFELFPYQNTASLGGMLPVASADASSRMSFRVELEEDSERLYAKFVLARRGLDGAYSLFGTGHYIDNPEAMSDRSYAYPTYASKKGLAAEMYSDAQLLALSHTVINVPVNEYLCAESSNDTVNFSFQGKTYSVQRDKLEYLDYRIALCAEAGIHPYLNIMLTTPNASTSRQLDCLYASADSGAVLYAFNVGSEDAVHYLEAFLDFLAGRYTDPATRSEYGFAGSFIFGYEVNDARNYAYMGAKSLEAFVQSYTAAYRIADTALRSNYANGRCYISISNRFAKTGVDAQLDYAGKTLVETFAARLRAEGDLPWGLAFSAYPSDRSIVDYREDENATDASDSPYLSLKNLSAAVSWMKGQSLRYNGETRRMLLASYGVGAGADGDQESMQAALFAYAYYRLEGIPEIEAAIYHRHVDGSGDAAHDGLWKRDDAGALSKRPLYAVFRGIDTQLSASLTGSMPATLGASDWSALLGGVSPTSMGKKILLSGNGVSSDAQDDPGERVFDFTQGSMGGFTPSDNAQYMELRSEDGESMLYTKLYNTGSREYMGVGCSFASPVSIRLGSAMTFDVLASAPNENAELRVMLRLYGHSDDVGQEVIYECEGTLAGGSWTQLRFDITPFTVRCSSLSSVKLWVSPSESDPGVGSIELCLKSVSLSAGRQSVLIRLLLWLALLLLSAILLAAVGLLTLRWMNARKRRKHRAAQQEHMRRMAERRRLQEQYRIRQEYSQGPSAPESEQKQEDEKKPSDPESSDIEEL